jgi:hypothetical protein
MEMMLQLNREELNALQYPVVVEMWDRVQGSMSKRRKYNEAFTEKERNTIRRYKSLFHNWFLVKGTPENAVMSLATLTLLKRAIDFFGTI